MEAGGLLLLLSCPFLSWVNVPLAGLTLPIPGLFLKGGFVLAWAVLAMGFWLLRPRYPGLLMVAGLAVLGTVTADLLSILKKTPRELGMLQLKLSGLNQTLTTLRLPELEVYQRGASPWDYVGMGVYLAFAGAGLLLLGAFLETLLQSRQGRSLGSVLVGRPACKACGQHLTGGMNFCPGCGHKLLPIRKCAECRSAYADSFRFCPECGAAGS